MAAPIVMQYQADSERAINALTAVIARLGYTLNAVNNRNVLVTFETGMSESSWAGQRMSAHVLPVANAVQITITGTRKAHGAQLQLADFGEARGIATKVFEELNTVLGQGRLISGQLRHEEITAAATVLLVGGVVFIAIAAISRCGR
jgi:hypothetical protein